MFGFNREDRLSRIEMKLNHVLRRQGDTLRKLNLIAEMELLQMAKLADWEAALQADTDATNAVETAINKLAEQIKQLGIDNPALDAVLAGITANSARTAALALANTPADPGTPVPDPVVPPPA